MPVKGAIILPHPPIIMPEVGRGREKEIQKTIDAYKTAAHLACKWQPETLVLISPHIVMYSDYFHIPPGLSISGDMSQFGAPKLRLTANYDTALRDMIIKECEAMGIEAGELGQRDRQLDHGSFIPLRFLQDEGLNVPIVQIGLSGFSAIEHYKLGKSIALAANKLSKNIAVISSGDLSHKLKDDGPYGYSDEGPEFDSFITKAMKTADFLQFLTVDSSLSEEAGECGLRSFQIMAGVLDGLAVLPKLYSYEGTFGVGYAVASYEVKGIDDRRCFEDIYVNEEKTRLDKRKINEDPWVRLARLSLETHIKDGRELSALPEGLPDEMISKAAGVFVTLHKYGQLRGCIGTIAPTTESTAWEIVQNAVSAGSADPRFPGVEEKELGKLEYSVDVLGEAEYIDSPEELDVKRYGVIVSSGRKRGLLLPNLDGVDSVDKQLEIACSKGGINKNEKYKIQRFEVVRHY